MTFWSWLIWILTWLSSDPAAFDREASKAAAAVSAARSSMLVDAPRPPAPGPKPTPDQKCKQCNGTGWIVQPDGHRTKCPCGLASKQPCETGQCRTQ